MPLAFLQALLLKLWVLWEMALVGEPLLVVAPSPSETSSTVAAIASLIAPLPYSGDFRPYYTIHDPQFSGLVARSVLFSFLTSDPVPQPSASSYFINQSPSK